jgi:UDP-glucose 4-epimerase
MNLSMHNRDKDNAQSRLVGITGATGFLGSYILRHLASSGRDDLRALSRAPAPLAIAPERVRWARGDLTSPRDCETFTEDLGALIHLAHTNTPLSSQRDWGSDATLNILPTLNLLEALRKQRRRVDMVFVSSGGAIYGTRTNRAPFKEDDATYPSSPYGVVKLALENYLRLAADEGWLRVTILRIANAYGTVLLPERRQGLIGVAINQVLRGKPVPIYGDPENVRDYVHLRDIADIVERCLQAKTSFDIYNVASGQGTSTEDVIALIEKAAGHPVERQHMAEIVDADRLVPWAVLDIAKAKTALGWQPRVALADGIEALYRQGLSASG